MPQKGIFNKASFINKYYSKIIFFTLYYFVHLYHKYNQKILWQSTTLEVKFRILSRPWPSESSPTAGKGVKKIEYYLSNNMNYCSHPTWNLYYRVKLLYWTRFSEYKNLVNECDKYNYYLIGQFKTCTILIIACFNHIIFENSFLTAH